MKLLRLKRLNSKTKKYITFNYPNDKKYLVVYESEDTYLILIDHNVFVNSVQQIPKIAKNIKLIIYDAE